MLILTFQIYDESIIYLSDLIEIVGKFQQDKIKMAKAIKTEKVVKHWFESRNHGKSLITAIRNPKNIVEPKIEIKTDKKLSPNMAAALKVLETNGKLSIDQAATELLKIHKLRTDNFEQAKKIFLHSSKYGLNTIITKEGKEKYVELA
jgi:hypothetical protein